MIKKIIIIKACVEKSCDKKEKKEMQKLGNRKENGTERQISEITEMLYGRTLKKKTFQIKNQY